MPPNEFSVMGSMTSVNNLMKRRLINCWTGLRVAEFAFRQRELDLEPQNMFLFAHDSQTG
jgi:hypothetical protein